MTGWAAASIDSPTGARLHCHWMAASGPPRAIVQINHGMAEHSARYERFATFLASRSYATIAHDHRGHGHTTAPGAPLGVFAPSGGMAKVLEDVSAVMDHARSLSPGTPLVLFGHSMGTIIALNHAHEYPGASDAAAFWNTSFDTPALLSVLVAVLKAERFFKGSDVPSAFAVKATFDAWNKQFAPNRTGFDWLSNDTVEVDKYVADPLCGFPVSIGLWLDVIASIKASADDRRVARIPRSMPVNIVAGGRDPSSANGAAMLRLADRLRSVGIADVTATVYPHARHECLNEQNRDEVMADFAGWLDARFPPR
jgi:alpha-beta hydrolase superfamily lysophospholipase